MASQDNLRKELKELLTAFDSKDPPPDRQKAVTPGLLRDMRELAGKLGSVHEHTTDLIVGAFLFAMRGCESSLTVRLALARTKLLELGNIVFRGKRKSILKQDDKNLEHKAHYVTVCFM